MSAPQPKINRGVEELPPETQLLGGRLVLDVRIGSGGASTVYAATTDDGRDVAVKIMSAEHAKLATSRLRFGNEVALAQHLADHPHVVTPYELGDLPELDGRPYITMPLVTGRSLMLMLGRLPLVDAITLLRDLAQTVADVHDRGIVHRDIKPSNVIVREQDGERVPYLIDFGLAHGTGDGTAPVSARLTAAHELPGTKHYMAPEQVFGAAPDPRFDVYALGITMVEVLTGIVPLHELSPADAARRKCDASKPSLSITGRMDSLPDELVRVIDGALERDPAERTPSAHRLAKQLTAVLDRLRTHRSQPKVVAVVEAPSLTEPEPNRPTEPTRVESHLTEVEHRVPAGRRRWLVWTIAAATVLLLAVGVSAVLGDPSSTAEASPSKVKTDHVMVGIAASSGAMFDGSGSADATSETTDTTGDVSETTADLEPEPEPEPRVQKQPRKPRPSPKRQTPRPEPCADMVPQARTASSDRRWRRVLQLTKAPRCWDDRDARIWLRVEALSELGRYEECAELGRSSRDPEITRMVKSCVVQLGKESSP